MAENRMQSAVASHGWSDAQRAAVVEEMNHILNYPAFKSSKRCVELLRFLIDRALTGEEEGIKERTLGVEVYGREANYDTNTDPIVRRTANEIRKRLAQCYQEPDRHHTVKISLNQGSYLPKFDFEPESRIPAAVETEGSEESPEPSQSPSSGVTPFERVGKSYTNVFRSRWMWWSAAALLLIVFAGVVLLRSNAFRSTEYLLWKPLLDSNPRVILVMSDENPQVNGQDVGNLQAPSISSLIASHQAPPALDQPKTTPSTPFVDIRVANAIVNRLSALHEQSSLRPSSALTFRDFRDRPAILIGGLNNPWSLILLSNLRYRVRIDAVSHDKWIEDTQNPSKRDWRIDGKLRYTDTSVGYALVTRFFNGETGQWVLALSGLDAHGTEAAGELVSDAAFAKILPSSVRSNKNIQIVLSTSVTHGSTGPLQVLAVYTW